MDLADQRIDISVTCVLVVSCLAIRTEVSDMLAERNVDVQAEFIDPVESQVFIVFILENKRFQ